MKIFAESKDLDLEIETALACPNCGAGEHSSSLALANYVIYSCGHVQHAEGEGDNWVTICPCPASLVNKLVGALQAVANCGNTCFVCQREIGEVFEYLNPSLCETK